MINVLHGLGTFTMFNSELNDQLVDDWSTYPDREDDYWGMLMDECDDWDEYMEFEYDQIACAEEEMELEASLFLKRNSRINNKKK